MASALEQLLNLLHGNGHEVEVHVQPEAAQTPLIQDPIKHNEPRFDEATRTFHPPVPAMKNMTPEGAALMQLMQAHGVDIGPEDLYEDTKGVLQKRSYIPGGQEDLDAQVI